MRGTVKVPISRAAFNPSVGSHGQIEPSMARSKVLNRGRNFGEVTYRNECVGLENPSLFLQPTDIFHDLVHVFRLDGIDLRHIAKLPMMGLNPVRCRPLEGYIAVMVRFIHFVKKRWALVGSDAADAMAS